MRNERSHLRLGARIGRGGMAEVFAGRLIGVAGFEKDVAVKRVLPRHVNNPVFLSRFLDEARLAARLSHPNIVQIFELGQEGADHYIVMEAVRGANLGSILDALEKRGEKMPVSIALAIAEGMCAGLAYAHDLRSPDGKPLGIVHRDVSPQNVLIGFEGQVKLIDFGIARALDNPSATQSGQLIGKPQFMAPEHLAGERVDGRADLYALGAVLFEMLSGRRAFEDADTGALLFAVAQGHRPHLRDANPELDADVIDVVEKAMATGADDRFQTGRALSTALAAAARGRTRVGAHELEALMKRLFPEAAQRPWPVDARAERSGDKAAGTADEAAEAPRTATVDVRPPRDLTLTVTVFGDTTRPEREHPRRAVPLAASLGVLVLLLTLGGGIALSGRSTPPPRVPPTAPAPVPPPPVAAPVDAGSAPVVVDAGAAAPERVPDAGSPSDDAAAPGLSRTHTKKVRMGRLEVETKPWSEVRVGGKLLGITPLAVSVPVGAQVLKLSNPEQGLSKTVSVTVAEGKPAIVRVDLRQ